MLSRAVVDGFARRRVVDALADCAREGGIGAVTVTDVCAKARMGRNTFYSYFRSVEECRRYAFTESFERLFSEIEAPPPSAEQWLGGVREVIGRFHAAVREQPAVAELCLHHSLSAPEGGDDQGFEAAVAAMSNAFAGGRPTGREACGADYHDPPPPAEDFLARATVSLAAKRVREDNFSELDGDRDEMVKLIANQFFGLEEGARQWAALIAAMRHPGPG